MALGFKTGHEISPEMVKLYRMDDKSKAEMDIFTCAPCDGEKPEYDDKSLMDEGASMIEDL